MRHTLTSPAWAAVWITDAALTTGVTRQLGVSTGFTVAFTARDQGDLTETVTGC